MRELKQVDQAIRLDTTKLKGFSKAFTKELLEGLTVAGLIAELEIVEKYYTSQFNQQYFYSDESNRNALVNKWQNCKPAVKSTYLYPIVTFAKFCNLSFVDLISKASNLTENVSYLKAWLLAIWYQERVNSPEDAVKAFESSDMQLHCDANTAKAYVRALNSQKLYAKKIDFIRRVESKVGTENMIPELLIEYAAELLRAGDSSSASKVLNDLLECRNVQAKDKRVPKNILLQAMHLVVDNVRSNNGEGAALDCIGAFLADIPQEPTLLARKIRLINRVHGYEAAINEFKTALNSFNAVQGLIRVWGILPISDKDCGEILDIATQLQKESSTTPSFMTLWDMFLLSFIAGRLELSRTLAKEIEYTNPLAKYYLRNDITPSERIKQNWPSTSIELALSKDSTFTIILVNYMRSIFGAMPRRMIDKVFEDNGINVVYCRDFSNRFFLEGDGRDINSFAEFVKKIGELEVVRNSTRVMVLGMSGSGFPAIRIAHALEIQDCLVFSPKTSLMREQGSGLDLAFTHGASVLGKQQQETLDLALSWPEVSRTSVTVLYPDASPVDKRHVERIRGLNGVICQGLVDMNRHEILSYLVENGDFFTLLERFKSNKPLL